jgi:NADH-quinone oxidoreductase subunit N
MMNVLLPESIVTAGLLGLVAIYACLDKKYQSSITVAAVVVYAIALGALSCLQVPESQIVWWHGLFVYDGAAYVSKLVILGVMALLTLCSVPEKRDFAFPGLEFTSLMGFSALGMMVTVSAAHWVSLFTGLELMYLPLYALVVMRKKNAQAQEAAIKYIILGALATAFLLYGTSLLYAVTGSMQLEGIQAALSGIGGDMAWQGKIPGVDNVSIAQGASILILAALVFKFGALPFHMWVPDVYQGASNIVVGTIASLPKLVLLVVWCRVFGDNGALAPLVECWQVPVYIMGIASILLGNIAGLAQTRVRRMLAYSSISHMGMVLLALGLGNSEGITAAWVYVIGYIIMTVTLFLALVRWRKGPREAVLIEDVKGLYKSDRAYATVWIISLFSMMGMPPFLGFILKVQVLMALVHGGQASLALIAVIGSVIGAFYYLRVIQNSVFYDKSEGESTGQVIPDWSSNMVLTVSAGAVLLSGIMPMWLFNLVKLAV